jgi:hypothetical protein
VRNFHAVSRAFPASDYPEIAGRTSLRRLRGHLETQAPALPDDSGDPLYPRGAGTAC